MRLGVPVWPFKWEPPYVGRTAPHRRTGVSSGRAECMGMALL